MAYRNETYISGRISDISCRMQMWRNANDEHQKCNCRWSSRMGTQPEKAMRYKPSGRIKSIVPQGISDELKVGVGTDTGYHDGGVSWFSSLPSGEFRGSSLKPDKDRFHPYPPQFIIHLSPYHSTSHSLKLWTKRRKMNYKVRLHIYCFRFFGNSWRAI
jgi:hypothetical protein